MKDRIEIKICSRCGGKGEIRSRRFQSISDQRAATISFLFDNPGLWRGKDFPHEFGRTGQDTPWGKLVEELKRVGLYAQSTNAFDISVDSIVKILKAVDTRR